MAHLRLRHARNLITVYMLVCYMPSEERGCTENGAFNGCPVNQEQHFNRT